MGPTTCRDAPPYVLRLFVSSATVPSQRAVVDLVDVLEREVPGDWSLEVVDVHRSPHLALNAQVLATPTVLRVLPGRSRRLVGAMSDAHRVMHGLGLRPRDLGA